MQYTAGGRNREIATGVRLPVVATGCRGVVRKLGERSQFSDEA